MIDAELSDFVRRYGEAFGALDGAAVARLYAEPSAIVSDLGYAHWSSRAAVEANMRALCDLYRADGVTGVEGESKVCHRLGASSAFIVVNWSLSRAAGTRNFSTAYNLSRIDGEWLVRLCTAFEERPLNRRGALE